MFCGINFIFVAKMVLQLFTTHPSARHSIPEYTHFTVRLTEAAGTKRNICAIC